MRGILVAILFCVGVAWAQQKFVGTVDLDGDVAGAGGMFLEKGVTIPYTNPRGYLNVLTSGTNESNGIVMQCSNTDGTKDSVLAFSHSRGTVGSETVTQSGDILGTILFQGYTGNTPPAQWGATGVAGNAGIEAYAAQTFSTTVAGTRLSFFNTSSGTTALNRWDVGDHPILTRFPNTATTLPTGATAVFYGLGRDAGGNATETTAGLRTPVPAMHCTAITCAVEPNAGAGSDALIFQLRANAANVTGLACTITTTATNCQARVSALGSTAVAAGAVMAISVTGVSSPVAVTGMCTVYCTYDAW